MVPINCSPLTDLTSQHTTSLHFVHPSHRVKSRSIRTMKLFNPLSAWSERDLSPYREPISAPTICSAQHGYSPACAGCGTLLVWSSRSVSKFHDDQISRYARVASEWVVWLHGTAYVCKNLDWETVYTQGLLKNASIQLYTIRNIKWQRQVYRYVTDTMALSFVLVHHPICYCNSLC